jgi:hypothetical protein
VFLCHPAMAIACSGITLHTASGDTTKYTLISDFKMGMIILHRFNYFAELTTFKAHI